MRDLKVILWAEYGKSLGRLRFFKINFLFKENIIMAFKFNAEVRTAQGKGASRRLRHNGQIPAIVYGGSEAPVSIVLNHDELNNAQEHDGFYSDVITLVIDGKEVAVKVQAMQRHPFKPKLVHIDFKRV